MKRALYLVFAAILLFSAGSYVLWTGASDVAYEKTLDTLKEARASFVFISESAIEGVLWFASRLVFDEIDTANPPPAMETMQSLADRHHVDEINIISTNGIILVSNLKEMMGFDMKPYRETQEVLKLLDPNAPQSGYAQAFRSAIGLSTNVCMKYFAIPFPDHSGALEIGVQQERIIDLVDVSDNENSYHMWTIGQYGYFSAVDSNRNGRIDRVEHWGDIPEEGILRDEHLENGEEAYVLYFPYSGLVYRAIVPKREFYEQRNRVVLLACSVSGVLFLLLVFFVVKILRATSRLDEMHRHMEARTAHELALAHNIQLSSLQRAELFRLYDFDSSFSAVTYPAREVGGDLYGLFVLPNGRVAFSVGDVSGKGVPAAMFMHVAKNTFELNMRSQGTLEEAVTRANAYLCESNKAEMFVTAWFGVLDPKTGVVEYVNAGHNRPYVLRASGAIERVDGKGGRFLGMFPDATYRSHFLQLRRGDRLFVYTDGVTEAMDPDKRLYGEARLVSLLRQRPLDLCKAVKRDIDEFTKTTDLSDDLTMLVLAYHGTPEKVEQEFPAEADLLADMLEFVRGIVRFRHPKQESRLLSAVDEVLSNIVNYSGSPTVTIGVKNVPGRCCITISDAGTTYDPLLHKDPNIHTTLEDRPIGGLGILMVKKLVSAVSYHRDNGTNVLKIVQIDFDGKFRQVV